MNKSLLTVIGVVLALVLGLIGVLRPATVVREVTNLGATADTNVNPFRLGDMRIWANHTSIRQSTTTVCSIQSPVATSTLLHGSIGITTGTTTALTVEIARDISPSATTTRLALAILPAGAKATVNVGTTTSAVLSPTDTDVVFPPNTYLNFKIGGPNGPLNVLEGSCNAMWVQVSGY